MARIPTVQEPSVQTERLPADYSRPFATPQGQGAALGGVMEQGAHVASQYAVDAIDRANVAATDGAWGAGKQVLNIKVKDPAPDGVGYARLRGKDAMDERTRTVETVNKSLDEVNASLNPEQQRMFAPRLQSLKEEAFNHIISHESTEQNRYTQQLFQGTSDSIMQEMQMPDALKDPVKLAQKRRDLMQVGINRAKETLGKNASSEAIQSVLVPDMQQAALGTMQAALQEAERTGDPTIAQNAFKVMGKDLLKNHQKQIGGMVEALTAKKAIADGAQGVIGAATDSVILPDGGQVARVDGGKVAAGVANLKDDTPHLSEIQDTIEKKQARLGKVWDGAVGTVYDRVEGDSLKGGGFDLDRASAVDKEWLRQHAPGLLHRLEKEDERGTRATATRESHDAYSELMLDMDANKEAYKEMSVPEFGQVAVKRGVGGLDLDKARKHFADVQKGGLSETINKTVAESLTNVFPDDAETRKHLQGDLLDATKAFVEDWQKNTKGQTPKTKDIRQFVEAELVSGKVKDVHWYFDPRVTRLEYQRTDAYRGKSFEPLDATAKTIPEPAAGQPEVQTSTPVAAPRQPPMPGGVHITNGTQTGWLPPGKPMPSGWKAD